MAKRFTLSEPVPAGPSSTNVFVVPGPGPDASPLRTEKNLVQEARLIRKIPLNIRRDEGRTEISQPDKTPKGPPSIERALELERTGFNLYVAGSVAPTPAGAALGVAGFAAGQAGRVEANRVRAKHGLSEIGFFEDILEPDFLPGNESPAQKTIRDIVSREGLGFLEKTSIESKKGAARVNLQTQAQTVGRGDLVAKAAAADSLVASQQTARPDPGTTAENDNRGQPRGRSVDPAPSRDFDPDDRVGRDFGTPGASARGAGSPF